jgi:hypothetical protein
MKHADVQNLPIMQYFHALMHRMNKQGDKEEKM